MYLQLSSFSYNLCNDEGNPHVEEALKGLGNVWKSPALDYGLHIIGSETIFEELIRFFFHTNQQLSTDPLATAV